LLGPGGARDEETARDLVHAALSDRPATGNPGERRLLLPIESRYLDVLRGIGLQIERRLDLDAAFPRTYDRCAHE
jgi:hypothetical protein